MYSMHPASSPLRGNCAPVGPLAPVPGARNGAPQRTGVGGGRGRHGSGGEVGAGSPRP